LRYEADFVPLLTILIFICLGWAFSFFETRKRLWNTFAILVLVVCVASIIIGLLVNFQGGPFLFRNGNPALFLFLSRLFTGKFNLLFK
jgi:hypothetical protein